MPTEYHALTKGVFNRWLPKMRKKQGITSGPIDWKKVTEADMRELSKDMFDAGKVPKRVRDAYWIDFDKMIKALEGGGK